MFEYESGIDFRNKRRLPVPESREYKALVIKMRKERMQTHAIKEKGPHPTLVSKRMHLIDLN